MSSKPKPEKAPPIDILSVSSEVYPLIKTGGLADVVGALPAALVKHNVRMRVLIPGYRQLMGKLGETNVLREMPNLFGGPARLLSAQENGLELIVIDAPHLYDRGGTIYQDPTGKDWTDNWKRFAALSFVGAQCAYGLVPDYQPRLIHAHDWQSGLVPAYLRFGAPTDVKSIITVHNLAFQGQFAREIFGELMLPPEADSVDGVEYYGGVGYLKAGLQCADAITTVSPTYAGEIRTAEFGMGLEGVLNSRIDTVYGILNGIDVDAWDPGTDTALVEPFRASTVKRRGANKSALRERFGLAQSDTPLFGVVSRLTWQKGLDVLANVADEIVAVGAQLCILGTGEPQIEAALEAAAARHPENIGLIKGYDEPLAHLVQGGADAILVPSRFEPCGLTQLIGLRYGSIPVVARTGGLADTVIDANDMAVAAGAATGVQFSPLTEANLMEAVRRTIRLYRDEAQWAQIQRRGMKTDVSWNISARKYAELYGMLLGKRG